MVKKKSIFDDRPVEIQELTFIVKQDINGLNQKIGGDPFFLTLSLFVYALFVDFLHFELNVFLFFFFFVVVDSSIGSVCGGTAVKEQAGE